jgi:hypothetical protein
MRTPPVSLGCAGSSRRRPLPRSIEALREITRLQDETRRRLIVGHVLSTGRGARVVDEGNAALIDQRLEALTAARRAIDQMRYDAISDEDAHTRIHTLLQPLSDLEALSC